MLASAGLALTLFLAFRDWQQRPRFQSLWLAGLVTIGRTMCGLTLPHYNLNQYELWPGDPDAASPAVMIIFNVVVLLVYATFNSFKFYRQGLSARKKIAGARARRSARRPSVPSSPGLEVEA